MSLSPDVPRARRAARPLCSRPAAWSALIRLAALALALGACTDSPTQPSDDRARLSVSAAVAGTPIATIVITVSAADMARPLAVNGPPPSLSEAPQPVVAPPERRGVRR